MNFNILQKPPTSGDQREMYRWFYRICEILNGPVTPTINGTYADNTAALAGGLVAGEVYKTTTGVLMVVY